MDRYITIKRKLSPEKSDLENKPKNTRDNSTLIKNVAPANTIRFALLVDTAEDVPLGSVDIEPKKTKPPPIYIREKSTSGFYSLLQTVVEACQKKKHCKFHGSPEFYGQGSSGVGDSSGTSSYHSSTASSNAISSDPCPKRKKIVEVAYKCRPYEFRSKVACHNDVAQLECNPYSRIAVYSASFGRTEYESIQCPQPQGVREEMPKQVLKENKALEVEADEPEDFGGDLNDLYDDELIYKESEAIPKLYSNTTTTVRRNGTRSLGFEFSVNSANNQSMTNSSLVVEGDRSGVNPVMTHSADLSLEEDQERLYFYLLVLVSLGVLISIAIFGTRIALQKHRLITETLSSSLAKTTRRAVEETTIPSGFNDTISEIDAEIDLKTTLPLPSLSKENYLTYAPTSSLYADLPCNQLVSACSPGSAAGQIGKPHMVGSRQSPDLIGITPGPFVTTSMAGLGGPMAGMVTSAIVIGDSTPSSSSLGTMIPITQYTTAPTIRGGYVISAENMGVIQRANNTPTPLNLLSGSTPEHPPQAGPIISAGAMNVTPQAHGPISAGGASKLRRVKPPFLQPQLSYDGTAPRTLSTGVAVGSQFYYG
ncbi:GD22491 [Drosophila simulans]|uniref:GD22491 n=1 Tax=Drosophila simulans TaxID=7240 RepID=B4NV33_DROSI|nr:GD22491 [Drosophila simulans]